MSAIFISYRRDDQPGFSGRLADALGSVFGAANVFRDIEDIGPGEDFAVAIQNQFRAVDVVLVLIGPGWLTASKNGVRRLDEPGDLVCQEIQAGLESGKPVLPVLIGGASMPAEKDLPTAIAALARRQAVILSDISWSSDITRLVAAIKPLLPLRRRLSFGSGAAWGLAAMGLIVLLVLGLKLPLPGLPTPWPSPTSAQTAPELSGRWTAQVKYDWGARHQEAFELRLEHGGQVHGTASYLKLARTVEQGRLAADRLTFITHSQEILGDSPAREVTHRYRGLVKAGELHLVLESTGGYSTHSPVEFIAQRAAR